MDLDSREPLTKRMWVVTTDRALNTLGRRKTVRAPASEVRLNNGEHAHQTFRPYPCWSVPA
eukprot:6760610-Heterocapsa_arctica.AAC.1